MSHYKTPIRISVNSTRKVNNNIGKYRLPFRKDQPVNQKMLNISSNGKQQYFVSPQTLRGQSSIKQSQLRVVSSERIQSKQQSPKNKNQQKSNKGSPQNSKEQVTMQQEDPKNNQNIITTQLLEPQQAFQPEGIHSSNSKRLYQNPMVKKLRYYSVSSHYQQDDSHQGNMADRSLQTDFQPQFNKKQRWDRKSDDLHPITQTKKQQKVSKKSMVDLLPSITNKKVNNRQLYRSLKKDQTKTWNALSQQIQQYRSQSLKKQLKKRKRTKSHNTKINKNIYHSNIQDNQCLQIEQQLKRLQQEKSRDLLYHQDPYTDLSPIPQDTIESAQIKQKQHGFIQQLKQVIDKQEQNKKSKLKYPLEHYIQNYYKIKQINPFFRKLNQLAGCILLNIGKLKIVDNGHLIYDQGQPLAYIYVIIVGKVMLVNSYKSFKKFALTGQTLAQEALFEQSKSYNQRFHRGCKTMFHRQEAKALGKVCLLKIRPQKYYKISNQLNSIGYKGLFNLIDNLLKINYFKKQTIYHGKGGERINTESLLNPRVKPSHFFR